LKNKMEQKEYTICIVEDDNTLRTVLAQSLENNFKILTADSVKAARYFINNEYIDFFILDLQLPDGSGLNLIPEILNVFHNAGIIMATAQNDVRLAVEAIKRGASDYLVKPFEIEELKIAIDKLIETLKLKKHIETLETEIEYLHPRKEIIGKSEAIKKVFEKLESIYNRDVLVLLLGETGVGKELFAREIHYRSNRKNKPFIPINCAAIPDNLIENELFGHIEGSYTGAFTTQRGKFEIAAGGIIFLDEISALSLSAQVKLLRTLEEKKFMRLGDTKEIYMPARIIAATSIDLEMAVKKNLFREDLFYRINIFPVKIPALRERREDIPLLIDYFIKIFNKKYSLQIKNISKTLLDFFMKLEWKGNVRELENTIEQLCLLSKSETIDIDILNQNKQFKRFFYSNPYQTEILDDSFFIELNVKMQLDEIEAKIISAILEKNDNNISKTSKILGISRKTLTTKVNKNKS